MRKYPLLEQMRATRQRREDEVTAPYKSELSMAGRMIADLRKRLRDIEVFMGSEISGYVTEEIGRGMSSKLREIIVEAASKCGATGKFTVTLPTSVIGFMDPRSLESEILARYKAEALPRLSLRIETMPTDRATIVDIRVPDMGYRRVVSQ
jgi:hypothetical protein